MWNNEWDGRTDNILISKHLVWKFQNVRGPIYKALQAGHLKGLAYNAHETCKRSQYAKFLPSSEVENNEGQDEKQDAYTHPDAN